MKKSMTMLGGVAVLLLAGCVEEETSTTEADISEANRATECPVDVTEADRADYPGCD